MGHISRGSTPNKVIHSCNTTCNTTCNATWPERGYRVYRKRTNMMSVYIYNYVSCAFEEKKVKMGRKSRCDICNKLFNNVKIHKSKSHSDALSDSIIDILLNESLEIDSTNRGIKDTDADFDMISGSFMDGMHDVSLSSVIRILDECENGYQDDSLHLSHKQSYEFSNHKLHLDGNDIVMDGLKMSLRTFSNLYHVLKNELSFHAKHIGSRLFIKGDANGNMLLFQEKIIQAFTTDEKCTLQLLIQYLESDRNVPLYNSPCWINHDGQMDYINCQDCNPDDTFYELMEDMPTLFHV